MEEEPKKKHNYLILSIVASLFIIVVFGFAVFKPLFLQSTELNEQVKAKSGEYEAQKQKLEDLKILEENYNHQIKEEAKIANVALPTEIKTEELLSQIKEIASNSGLQLISFNPEQNSSQNIAIGTNYATASFNCTLYGTFSALKQTLKEIEQNLRIIDVNSIQLNKDISQEKGNVLNITLNFKAYWQPK